MMNVHSAIDTTPLLSTDEQLCLECLQGSKCSTAKWISEVVRYGMGCSFALERSQGEILDTLQRLMGKGLVDSRTMGTCNDVHIPGFAITDQGRQILALAKGPERITNNGLECLRALSDGPISAIEIVRKLQGGWHTSAVYAVLWHFRNDGLAIPVTPSEEQNQYQQPWQLSEAGRRSVEFNVDTAYYCPRSTAKVSVK